MKVAFLAACLTACSVSTSEPDSQSKADEVKLGSPLKKASAQVAIEYENLYPGSIIYTRILRDGRVMRVTDAQGKIYSKELAILNADVAKELFATIDGFKPNSLVEYDRGNLDSPEKCGPGAVSLSYYVYGPKGKIKFANVGACEEVNVLDNFKSDALDIKGLLDGFISF
jgi:hypothetical protein